MSHVNQYEIRFSSSSYRKQELPFPVLGFSKTCVFKPNLKFGDSDSTLCDLPETIARNYLLPVSKCHDLRDQNSSNKIIWKQRFLTAIGLPSISEKSGEKDFYKIKKTTIFIKLTEQNYIVAYDCENPHDENNKIRVSVQLAKNWLPENQIIVK